MNQASWDRRQFLTHALGGVTAAIGGGWLRPARAQTATALAETPLRDGLRLITGAGSNVCVLRTAAGAAIIDSGAPELAGELAKRVRNSLATAPVAALFNTHWHPA